MLDSTVTAPRLSGTKVQSLTAQALALSNQNLDADLITRFFRLNKGLPPTSTSRISSLYVFDAIVRGAKSASGKDKGKGKAGGAMGLLNKMEGVVESWVTGMTEDGKGGIWTEGKVSRWQHAP